jgi:hypothetical protein
MSYNKIITVNPVIDIAGAYASGDQMGAIIEIPAILPTNGGLAKLISVVVVDKDDEGGAFDLMLWSASVTLAADNAAVSISDADALLFLGKVAIASADYEDVGGAKLATKTGVAIPVTGASTSKSVYLSLISKDSKTYTATSDLVIKLGFEVLKG